MINFQLHKNFKFVFLRQNMNYSIALIMWMILCHNAYPQTQFQEIDRGPVVNTVSDSRSINLVDLNKDGLDDIFISNGPSAGAEDYLYINQGNFQFSEDTGFFKSLILPSVGACIGDIHNNGDRTIYVTSWYNRSNALYIKNALGQYTGSLTSYKTYSESAAWVDYDQDGWLDLYVSNAGNGPADNKNLIFKNNGTGQLNLLPNHSSTIESNYSRGVSWVDYDNDGDPDLFLCNENKTPNSLFRNDGNGIFTKILIAGDLLVAAESSMSASWADVNNDGWMDVFVCNTNSFAPAANVLYINQKNGGFLAVKEPFSSDLGCSFSASFSDYDNDGDVDLAVSNGFCTGNIFNFLYLNDGKGNFTRDLQSITDLSTPCSFGLAWSDLDRNGFQDLVISTCKNSSQAPLPKNIMFQNMGNDNHWLQLSLKGTESNADAIGARVRISTKIDGETVIQTREISTQTGYCSQNSPTVHFGLKKSINVDTVWIEWPSGIKQKLSGITANQFLQITEPMFSSVTDQKNSDQITISPNPAKDLIKIHFSSDLNWNHGKFELIDSKGKIVYSVEKINLGNQEYFELDTQSLQLKQGSYTLKFSSPQYQVSKRFLVIP